MSNNQAETSNAANGRLFIISAPSGAGKTSLIKTVVEETSNLMVSVSHTTRDPRAGETDEIDYFFISKSKFSTMSKNNEFIEEAIVFDHFYATSKAVVMKNIALGKNIILDIDWQGARNIKKAGLNSTSIFILPPSLLELETRLTGRGDDPKIVKRRMGDAINEIAHNSEYDHLIINDDFAEAAEILRCIIIGRKTQKKGQSEKLKSLLAELMPN